MVSKPNIIVMRIPTIITLLLITLSVSNMPASASAVASSSVTSQEPQTKYDYTPLAESIVEGCTTEYNKAKAIYKWLCDNIAYDTTYTIYHADECYEQRRGVCQAYCELYYHLAKCVGIDSRIICGKSKDIDGNIDSSGHAWIYTIVDGRGIFLDATWGAGSVNDGTFKRNKYIWNWFDVDPKFLIFTHFPDNDSDQFLYPAISFDEFLSLPRATGDWVKLRLDIDHMYDLALRGELRLPTFYSCDEITTTFEICEMPLERSLRVGKTYTFRVRHPSNIYNIALINNGNFVDLDQWHSLGGGLYAIDYMVRDVGGVRLGYKAGDGNQWTLLLDYAVEQPTADDWANVAVAYPLSDPLVKNTKNLHYAKEWTEAGIYEEKLAALIKQHNISELPIFYSNMGKHLYIDTVPMNYRLRRGESYTFSFTPRNGRQCAIIENGSIWHRDFTRSSDGRHTITITPQSAGMLYISINTSGSSYYHCIGYEVM